MSLRTRPSPLLQVPDRACDHGSRSHASRNRVRTECRHVAAGRTRSYCRSAGDSADTQLRCSWPVPAATRAKKSMTRTVAGREVVSDDHGRPHHGY